MSAKYVVNPFLKNFLVNVGVFTWISYPAS
jgi:hypothetical protein